MNLFLSVTPYEAERIYSGESVCLYRSRCPSKGATRAILYERAPVKAVTGEADVSEIVLATPRHVWYKTKDRSVLEKDEFDELYGSRDAVVCFYLRAGQRYKDTLPCPPAFEAKPFCYLDDAELRKLGLYDAEELTMNTVKEFVYSRRPYDFESLENYAKRFEPGWVDFLKSRRGMAYFGKVLESEDYKAKSIKLGCGDNVWRFSDGVLRDLSGNEVSRA